MKRSVLVSAFSLLAMAGLAACGNSRLTVRGHARLENAGVDLRTGFEFPSDIRLDGDADVVTGTCQVRRMSSPEGHSYAAIVDLFGGGSGPRALTLMGRTDGSSSSVEVQTNTAVYRSSASCNVEISYVDDSGSVTLDARDCAMSTMDAMTATFDAHLELHGCSVVSAD